MDMQAAQSGVPYLNDPVAKWTLRFSNYTRPPSSMHGEQLAEPMLTCFSSRPQGAAQRGASWAQLDVPQQLSGRCRSAVWHFDA